MSICFSLSIVGTGDISGADYEPIGTAVTTDGTEIPIRPDGSIVLPDGTVVTPSSDGTYPITVELTFDRDYWALQEIAV